MRYKGTVVALQSTSSLASGSLQLSFDVWPLQVGTGPARRGPVSIYLGRPPCRCPGEGPRSCHCTFKNWALQTAFDKRWRARAWPCLHSHRSWTLQELV